MTNKIIQAANAMLAMPERITNVTRSNEEFYFRFSEKHTWSIQKNPEGTVYTLYYYPVDESIDHIIEMLEAGGEGLPVVSYSSKDLRSQEADQTFRELYRVVSEKLYGVDKALDEIIKLAEDQPF